MNEGMFVLTNKLVSLPLILQCSFYYLNGIACRYRAIQVESR